MTDSKAKWRVRWDKVKNWTKENYGWVFGLATVAAAWRGYANSKHNQKGVRVALQRTEVLRHAVNNHADAIMADRSKMLELEHRQNELFEKALKETEGKAE